MIRIEWFVMFILIVACREIYGIYSKKPTDYKSGYIDAINDVIDVWNRSCDNKKDYKGRIEDLHGF